jgi:hypothetical protein
MHATMHDNHAVEQLITQLRDEIAGLREEVARLAAVQPAGEPGQGAYLTARDVRAQLGGKVSLQQVYDLFAEGALTGVRFGRKVLIEADSLTSYLRRQSNDREAEPAAAQPGVEGRKTKAGRSGNDFVSYYQEVMDQVERKKARKPHR